MYKIAVLGESSSVLGFGALGLDTFPVEDEGGRKRDVPAGLVPERRLAIIYITERYYEALGPDIDRFKDALRRL